MHGHDHIYSGRHFCSHTVYVTCTHPNLLWHIWSGRPVCRRTVYSKDRRRLVASGAVHERAGAAGGGGGLHHDRGAHGGHVDRLRADCAHAHRGIHTHGHL